jgi:hypothetical protein
MQSSGFHNLPNLGKNATAAIVGCQSNGVNVHVDWLFFGADVAARVRVSSSNDGNIDFEWLVPENLAAVDLHDLHEFFTAASIASSTVVTRIDKSSQT